MILFSLELQHAFFNDELLSYSKNTIFLQYIHQGLPKLCSNNANNLQGLRSRRVQDKELIEMVDEGFCMTVHQPYASHLIAGINLHVGKSWYSSHRGRLWIHAAVKKTLYTEIPTAGHKFRSSQENYAILSDLLLGFVTVVDVLSQDEYHEKYPENDLHSPYVFICVDPHEIALKIPMKGKPKICKPYLLYLFIKIFVTLNYSCSTMVYHELCTAYVTSSFFFR